MNSTLRSSAAAAAMLLGSVGALLASGPAAAQHATVYVQPPVPVIQGYDNRGYDHRGYDSRGYDSRGYDNRDYGDRGYGDRGYQERVGRRDQRPPQITDVTPDNGDRVADRGTTRISANFFDQGSGIDPRFVTLRVDGRDVTRESRVDADGLRYRDDLRPGRHVADLVVRDRAGNATRRTWTFDVVQRGREYGYYNGQQRW